MDLCSGLTAQEFAGNGDTQQLARLPNTTTQRIPAIPAQPPARHHQHNAVSQLPSDPPNFTDETPKLRSSEGLVQRFGLTDSQDPNGPFTALPRCLSGAHTLGDLPEPNLLCAIGLRVPPRQLSWVLHFRIQSNTGPGLPSFYL